MNEEAKKDDQAPAFGPGTKTDDIIIDYKPAEKPEQPGKSGEDGEADGSEGSGETDETENPDGTYVKGDVIDNSKKPPARTARSARPPRKRPPTALPVPPLWTPTPR